MRERATDGLEAFRVNRLRSEADSKISDKWVRFIQPDPRAGCVRERAVDGLEAFRVNRLRREADSEISDKWVRFIQPDPGKIRTVACGYGSLVRLKKSYI